MNYDNSFRTLCRFLIMGSLALGLGFVAMDWTSSSLTAKIEKASKSLVILKFRQNR